MLSLLLTFSACSLPDVTVEKKQKPADSGGASLFTKNDDHTAADPHANDKSYLATVHISFTENTPPLSFDIHRNRQETISFNLIHTEETATYLHFGYTHSDGGMGGLRFIWRF